MNQLEQLKQYTTVVADTGEQNSRYASWIGTAASAAQANSTGIWGACGGQITPANNTYGSAAASTGNSYTVSALPARTSSMRRTR